MKRPGDGSNVLADAVIGAVAGAAAIWALDRVDWFNWNHEGRAARRQTRAVRPGGMDPAHVIADKLGLVMGSEPEPKDDNPVGKAIHYSIGIAPAAVYSVVRHRVPALTAGRGSLFGLGLFLIQDEGLNALTGLSAPPGAYPWQAHARGLVAHVVYGLTLDAALSLADRLKEDASRAARPKAETQPAS